MTNRQTGVNEYMRPNIQISHSLNGNVKDFAAEHDMNTQEAYQYLIEFALDEHEDSE